MADTFVSNLSLTIKTELIDDALADALEGGCVYWCGGTEVHEWPEGAEYASDVPMRGGTVMVYDEEGDSFVLNRISIDRGLQAMAAKYPWQFGNLLNMENGGNYDANTADIFLQCCLFGEAIYG